MNIEVVQLMQGPILAFFLIEKSILSQEVDRY